MTATTSGAKAHPYLVLFGTADAVPFPVVLVARIKETARTKRAGAARAPDCPRHGLRQPKMKRADCAAP